MKEVTNISNKELHIVGTGTVKAGETIKVPKDFNNANFKEVGKKEVVNTLKNNNKEDAEKSVK